MPLALQRLQTNMYDAHVTRQPVASKVICGVMKDIQSGGTDVKSFALVI